ncbi:MAG: hypothetical protein PHD48_05425 [Alphaproteobacteria bacterium]|nr:hypothetical protein [Alphaproteobacteria bacterium]
MTKNTSQRILDKYVLPEGMSASLQLINPSVYPNDGPAMKDIEDLISHEAEALGTHANAAGFNKLKDAIKYNKVKVLALNVAYPDEWPSRVGAVIMFPTVHTEWDKKEKCFKTKQAVYIEDTAVNPDASAKFRRETVIDDVRPHGMGLGEFMNCELFRLSAGTESSELLWGASASAYVAECGVRSHAMHKIYSNLSGISPQESGLYVVEFKGAPKFDNNTRTTISIQNWGYYAAAHKANGELILPGQMMPDHVFSTNLRNGNSLEQIQADTTSTFSTFYGPDTHRVVINHSERIPSSDTKLVTFYGETLNAVASEILENRMLGSDATIDDVFRMMYVHIKDTGNPQINQHCMNALSQLGGKNRRLGTCFMHPVVLPYDKLNAAVFYQQRQTPTAYIGYTRSKKTVPIRTKRPAGNANGPTEQRRAVAG